MVQFELGRTIPRRGSTVDGTVTEDRTCAFTPGPVG
jgi:hypothetical protein